MFEIGKDNLSNPNEFRINLGSILQEENEIEQILSGTYAREKMQQIQGLIRLRNNLTTLNIYGKDSASLIDDSLKGQINTIVEQTIAMNNLTLGLALSNLGMNDELIKMIQPDLIENRRNYLRSTEEFFARGIGKIATLDLSEPSYDSPRLTDRLLDGLNRMILNGNRIFGNIIDRYRAAEALKLQGQDTSQMPPANGNNYTIIGIPRLENIPK